MLAAPPRLSQDLDLTPYSDGLHEIVPEKISEILEEMESLEKDYDHRISVIKKYRKRGELDDFEVWYWSYYTELEFADYYVHQKWLQYWLGIFEKLPGEQIKKLEKPAQKFDEFESKQQVERAKAVPIENLYQDQLKGTGARLSGRCPFHEEKTPSFFIFTNTNTFHCFGCQAHGDAIDFVMKTKELSFADAIRFLI